MVINRLPIVAPVLEYPALASLSRLENESLCGTKLDPDWAARDLWLSLAARRMMLVLDDPGGEAASDHYLGNR